jgi:ribosomal protein L24
MKKGDTVHWNWGQSEAEGKVVKTHHKPVQKTIKGITVKRNATKDNPAVEIKQKDGGKVLKAESEVKKGPK